MGQASRGELRGQEEVGSVAQAGRRQARHKCTAQLLHYALCSHMLVSKQLQLLHSTATQLPQQHSLHLAAQPGSPALSPEPLMKMLSHLRSRWMMGGLWPCRYTRPHKIW